MPKSTTISVGQQKYQLREDLPISLARYNKLSTHPAFKEFYFKKSSRSSNSYWWYVKTESSQSGFSTTQREEMRLLKESYKTYLNKNKK